jgi:uncharacterized protein (UPF0335 family)
MAVIWNSQLTEEMVSKLSEEELSSLIEELNEVIEAVCNGFDVK